MFKSSSSGRFYTIHILQDLKSSEKDNCVICKVYILCVLCVCAMHMCMEISGYICSCICKQKPEQDIGCFLLHSTFLHWDRVSHWTGSSLSCLHWLSREISGSTVSIPESCHFRPVQPYLAVTLVLWDWTSDLRFINRALLPMESSLQPWKKKLYLFNYNFNLCSIKEHMGKIFCLDQLENLQYNIYIFLKKVLKFHV